MDDLFKRIAELIGQEIDAPVCRQFVNDLGEEPMSARTLYFFPESGFSLICVQRIFVRAFLNVCTPRDPGFINSYKGNLPCDMRTQDSREVIRGKLSGKLRDQLVNSDDTEDQYDFPPLILFVKFAADDAEVSSLSLGYGDENLPLGLTPEMLDSCETSIQAGVLHRPVRKRVGPRHKPRNDV
jgi:hypothetical protein